MTLTVAECCCSVYLSLKASSPSGLDAAAVRFLPHLAAFFVDHRRAAALCFSPLSSPEQPAAGGLKEYVYSLFEGDAVPLPENEEWAAAVTRLSVPGRINEISEEIYFEFLEVLPPKLLRGLFFAFAEGQEPLRVFHRRHEHVRQMEQDRIALPESSLQQPADAA